jgi:hypothetical protein
MKTTHFLLTMIGCAVLTHGVAYADPSSATTAQPPSGDPNTKVSDHQPGSSPPAVVAPGGSAGNKTVIKQAVRSQGTVSLNGTSSKNANNRGPNPSVIGGPANSTKNTAAISGKSANPTKNMVAINGTGMNHKH